LPLPELKFLPPPFPELVLWLAVVPRVPLLLPELELRVDPTLELWLPPELKLCPLPELKL
jgi:hypothetical protein